MLSVTLYSPMSVPKSCRAVWKSRLTKPYQFCARDAGLGDRRVALPVIGHAEVRQAAEVGVDVVRRDLDVVGRRPLGRDEAAPAIVGHIVAPGDVGVLEHAAGANRKGRADHLVDVERDALGAVGTERALGIVEVGGRSPAW